MQQRPSNFQLHHSQLTQFTLECISNSTRKTIRNMVNNSKAQQMYSDQVKLYSPVIYDSLSRRSRNRQNSLHTLCVGLHIYEDYKQLTKSQKNGQVENQIMDMKRQDMIAFACLQISQDINQSQGSRRRDRARYNRQNGIQQKQIRQLKKQIMNALDWKLNYVTFVSISQQFLMWLNMNLIKINQSSISFQKNKQSQHRQNLIVSQDKIMNQMEVVLDHFNFFEKSAQECACTVIQRVLINCKMQIQVHDTTKESQDCDKFNIWSFSQIFKRILQGKQRKIKLKIQFSQEKQIESKFSLQPTTVVSLKQNLISPQIFQNTNSSLADSQVLKQFKQFNEPSNLFRQQNTCSIFAKSSQNKLAKPPLSEFRQKIISDKKIHQYFKPLKILCRSLISQSVLTQEQFSCFQLESKSSWNKQNYEAEQQNQVKVLSQ